MKKILIFSVVISLSALLFLFGLLMLKKNKPRVVESTILLTSTLTPTPTPAPKILTELNLEQMFSYKNPEEFQASDSSKIYLIATGDVIPARSANNKSFTKNDYTYPFLKTANFLKKGDITFSNLEAPLLKNCLPTTEGMIFCGSDKNIEGLKFAGIDIVNVANNHFGNYGKDGIEKTTELLKQNNINVVGTETNSDVIVVVKGKKFGFLGYNQIGSKEEGLSWIEEKKIQDQIKKLKNKVDYLIVQFHWGVEYVSDPNESQIKIARLAIDSGADLIIGNHPHWVQGVEMYKNKFIVYALGNFVFDQMWSQETKEGVVGLFTFNSVGLEDVSFYPVFIEDYSQPSFLDEKNSAKVLQRMKSSSDKIIKDNVSKMIN